ncbi:MAG TPA: hypothetical protein VNT32_11380 [Thermoleophilaceae bacterium]|nr:hypothetical protein [Thermoleophilaceae bacterium]
MRSRIALTLLCLTLTAGGCGGDESPEPVRLDAEPGGGVTDDLAGPGDSGSRASGDSGAPRNGKAEDSADDGPDSSGESGGGGGSSDRAGTDRKSDDEGASARGGSGKRGGSSPRPDAPAQREPSADDVAQVERARAAVSDLVNGLDKGDAGVCTRVMTLHYVETITGRTGDDAIRKCRADIGSHPIPIHVEAFGPSEYKDARAVVRVRLRLSGKKVIRTYDLRRDGGVWRVNAEIG